MSDPDETSKITRLENGTVPIRIVAGAAVLVLGWLVNDLRGSVTSLGTRMEASNASLNAKVDAALQSAAEIKALDASRRLHDLEEKTTRNTARIDSLDARQAGGGR